MLNLKYPRSFLFAAAVFTVLFLASCGKEVPINVMLAESLTEAENGNWEKSETISRKILKKEPENIHAMILSAIAMYNTNRLQEAMDTISGVIKLAPSHFTAQYLKGYFAFKSGDCKQAVKPLAMAHNLKPNDINTLILLAQTHYALKNDRLAVSFYKKLAITPMYRNDALPVNALGILFAKSNPRLAERYFKEAERRSELKDHPVTYLNTAIFYEINRNRSRAIFYYKKFLARTEKKAEFRQYRTHVQKHLNAM